MIAALFGIVFIIVAILLWVGAIGVGHALAIFIGLIGILLVLYWAAPGNGWRRRV